MVSPLVGGKFIYEERESAFPQYLRIKRQIEENVLRNDFPLFTRFTDGTEKVLQTDNLGWFTGNSMKYTGATLSHLSQPHTRQPTDDDIDAECDCWGGDQLKSISTDYCGHSTSIYILD